MPTLHLVGTPLDDKTPFSAEAKSLLASCDLIIGESRLRSQRLLRLNALPENYAFLDSISPTDQTWLESRLQEVSKKRDGKVALFSDGGMPALFDPGREVLHRALSLGYDVRTLGGQTSWSTACAVSGFLPPFLIYGFLPREKQERLAALKELVPQAHTLVFLETPYRWKLLLEQLIQVFGANASAFVAWNIAGDTESYWWGTLQEIQKRAEREGLDRGNFVFLLPKPEKSPTRPRR